MKEIVTTLTQRGQVTVPAEVRRLLGVKPREKLAFTIEGSRVSLRKATFTLESAAGSVEPPTATEDFERIAREAKEEQVRRSIRQSER